MNDRLTGKHRVFVALTLAAVCGILLTTQREATVHGAADVLQQSDSLRWCRGNIHTHSLWSDGDDYPEMIALWYREQGYQFLCFTDHNTLHDVEKWIDVEKSKGKRSAYDKLREQFPADWVEERTTEDRLEVRLKRFDEVNARIAVPDSFLLIQGEEITDRFKNLPIHLNATNLQQMIPPLGGETVYDTIQNNVSAVVAQRERTGTPMLIHVNHPNFGLAITAEDLMRVRGENFFEVYNGHPGVRNSGDDDHASTERIWDIILTRRLTDLDLPLMYGLATDDGHNYHNIPSRASEPGRGWVVVLAESLTPPSIIDAMEAGRFYSSSGVALQTVTSSEQGLDVEVQADQDTQYTIDFIGTRRDFDATSTPVVDKNGNEIHATRRYSDDVGAILQTVNGPRGSYRFRGDELYVRARVTSSRLHPNPSEPGEFERAWTQPVAGVRAGAGESGR